MPQKKKKRRGSSLRPVTLTDRRVPAVTAAPAAAAAALAPTSTSTAAEATARHARNKRRRLSPTPTPIPTAPPPTAAAPSPPPRRQRKSKPSRARRIATFHALLKTISNPATTPAARAAAEAEVDALGGLTAYQRLSRSGEREGAMNSARWVVRQLRELGLHQTEQRGRRACLRLLDVGALDNNYTSRDTASWIRATPIDLNAQTPAVTTADFFAYLQPDGTIAPDFCDEDDEQEEEEEERKGHVFDIVVLSLVLNFVPVPARRGEMLLRSQRALPPGGLLAVVLPAACVANSRYCTDGLLRQMFCEGLGFELVAAHQSPKLSHYLLRKQPDAPSTPRLAFPKRLIRSGANRNNFCIVLESGPDAPPLAAAVAAAAAAADSDSGASDPDSDDSYQT